VTFQVVLTKTDKLAARELARIEGEVAAALAKAPAAFPGVVVSSAQTGLGLDVLRSIIAGMADA
jgi:GTP-binding protein